MATVASYGSWSSPFDAAGVASSGRRLAAPTIAEDGAIWWAEGRPEEGGRVVLMRRAPGGEPETVTPPGMYVRTRFHESGGGSWHLAAPDLVLFVNFEDQRLYLQRLGEEPVAISPQPSESGALRYADMRLAPDGRTVVCVRERDAEPEPVNEIVALALGGPGEPQVLAGGGDFFTSPRVSADGGVFARRLAADERRRRLARLDLLGPPEHALGRDRALGCPALRQRRGAAGRRRAGGVDLPARVG